MNKLMVHALVFISGFMAINQAQALAPCEMKLNSDSAGGTEVKIEFFAHFKNDRFYPVNVRASVSGRDLKTYANVQFYLNWFPGDRNPTRAQRLYQLSGRPGYFYYDLGAFDYPIGINTTPRQQHVSVTIDGAPLIDPVGNKDYFQISFQEAAFRSGQDCRL
ncbi:MAG: hypothetical protein EOP09_13515 [Proteobacteria bacterium]|nr:MAG: hypothetical protein EOP09_13515 [Pseudomonadota bacterium]